MLSSAIVFCLRRLPASTARKVSRHLRISYDADIEGISFRCSVHNNVMEREFLLGTRGPADIEVRSVLDAVPPGGTVIDIGANIGLLTLFAARQVGSSGRVVAIEPLPAVVDRLRFNIASNGYSNVEVVMAAVGAERGTAKLYVRAKNYGQSSLVPVSGFEPVDVPVIPLAEIVAERGVTRIDALKIDVEGFEDRALLPFIRTAPRSLWPRRIVMETRWSGRWHEDCLAGLLAAGYVASEVDANDAVLDLK